MSGSSFLDVCRFSPTAGSTTDWTYSAAVTGYQSPSAAGVVNGAQYSYRAESADLSQWEIGFGTYNTGTGVLSRTTVLFNSSGGTSKINFSAVPQVAIVALAEDLLQSGVTKATQQTGTDTAHGVTPARQQDHDSALKAWAYVTVSGGVYTLAAGFNIASINKIGTGVVDLALSTAFASTSFGVVAGLNGVTTNSQIEEAFGSRTTSNVRVDLRSGSSGVNFDGNFSVMMFGRQ